MSSRKERQAGGLFNPDNTDGWKRRNKVERSPWRPQRRSRGARGRKTSLLARRWLVACWHEFEYREDWEGDPGVINGTYTVRWLQCTGCGLQLPAGPEDAPSYDDYGPEDVYY